MEQSFLAQLGNDSLQELLLNTALADTALILVGPTRHIAHYNEAGRQLTALSTMDSIDAILSEAAENALCRCIETHEKCEVPEELDGMEYRLLLLPHNDGALLAYLRDDRRQYDGTLRFLQEKSRTGLSALLTLADHTTESETSAALRRECLRIARLWLHTELLHEGLFYESVPMAQMDLAHLVRNTVAIAQTRTACPIRVNAPAAFPLFGSERYLRIALLNLLSNAAAVSPKGEEILVTLPDCSRLPVITVSDRGPGLEAEQFRRLLDGWARPMPITDYLTLSAQCARPGLGLPVVQCVAQCHGGALVFSPREGGGCELHMMLSRLPEAEPDHSGNSPTDFESGIPLDDIELSVF